MRFLLPVLLLSACPDPDPIEPSDTDVQTETETEIERTVERHTVRVTLDGVAVQGAIVLQGGVDKMYTSGADGTVDIDVDFRRKGDIAVHGSHPEARIVAVIVRPGTAGIIEVELQRFDPRDNAEFIFQDPGSPENKETTLLCAHCHITINEDWYGSNHRTAASNPELQDLYAGTASKWSDQAGCETAGGRWMKGLTPGTREPTDRCYLGAGVLPDLNDCGAQTSCDGVADQTGACADCHAPSIDGELGGRGLLEAVGIAYESGVQCDTCHKVESIDPKAEAGVAGRLKIVRPTDPAEIPMGSPWAPLQFGPSHDVANPRMGSVQRDHFRDGTLCEGCHQLDQAVLVPNTEIDADRWPDGRLPVHSTFSEWKLGPFGDQVPCNSCHMPPNPTATNGADLQIWDIGEGIAGGWVRPPGAVRHHNWVGPRNEESGMLQLAAALSIETRTQDGALVAEVTTKNVGPAHFIPTGEPSRTLVLYVRARCGDDLLTPIGGDAIPDFAGSYLTKPNDQDWSQWPGAKVGDTVRVIRRAGWRSDSGWGPFGDGTFTGAAAGMPKDEVVHIATINAVKDGAVTLDSALPEGDVAYLGPPLAPPKDGQPAAASAGAPGFAFARVLVDKDGRAMAPHHKAVDVRSDNRIGPGASHTSTHRFRSTCDTPIVEASLTWRAYPTWLATQKSWTNPERVMTEATR